MSYGYGLGVYWEDYNDPEEMDNDWCYACQTDVHECTCPEVGLDEGSAQITDSSEPPF